MEPENDPMKVLRENYPHIANRQELYRTNKELYYNLVRVGKLEEVLPTQRQIKKRVLEKVITHIIGEQDSKRDEQMDKSTKEFFTRNVKTVAKDLIGYKIKYGELEAEITKTDPYQGIAKSAHKKENFRQEPGYVWTNNRRGHIMLNINAYDTTLSCILINGVKINETRIKGPGNVTQALGIDDTITGTYVGDRIKIYKTG
jgi:hypothetical protein